MLIDNHYVEEYKGAFQFVSIESLRKLLGEDAIKSFSNKIHDFRDEVYELYKRELVSEKGKEYFSALHSVIKTKYDTKIFIEKMKDDNVKKLSFGVEEEKTAAMSEGWFLRNICNFVKV